MVEIHPQNRSGPSFKRWEMREMRLMVSDGYIVGSNGERPDKQDIGYIDIGGNHGQGGEGGYIHLTLVGDNDIHITLTPIQAVCLSRALTAAFDKMVESIPLKQEL
jgi:hypothetical protein